MKRSWTVAVIVALAVVLGGCGILREAPVIGGPSDPEAGDRLLVESGSWLTPGPVLSLKYTWERCEVDGTGCVEVAGTGGQNLSPQAYTPCAADVGRRLRAREYVRTLFGTSSAVTALTEPVAAWSPPPPGPTSIVSAPPDCGPSAGSGHAPVVSGDGRYVAYSSYASSLVPGDTNGDADVFVWDRVAGVTERVSVTSAGAQAKGARVHPYQAISADGRYVAFSSEASNLVPGDTNGNVDVFVRDRVAGVTERVSVASGGSQSVGDELWTYRPAISADGRFVAFFSEASDLVPGDTNGSRDVFVRDRLGGTTERVSVSSAGVQGDDASTGSGISADGRFVMFASVAQNLVPGDTNGSRDVFVRDRLGGTTERVSVSSAGVQGDDASVGSDISADGRFVTFTSVAQNLVTGDTNGSRDVFVRDRVGNTTELVSVAGSGEADGFSAGSDISADGRYVAFGSFASTLVPGDTNGQGDLFLRDRVAGSTERVSVTSAGTQANIPSSYLMVPDISGDGRFVVYESEAASLVPKGTTLANAYIWDRDFGE